MNQGLSGKCERVVERSTRKIGLAGTRRTERERERERESETQSGERVKGDTEGSRCGALVATGAVPSPSITRASLYGP